MSRSLALALLVLLAASHGVNDWLAAWLLSGGLPAPTVWLRLPWLVIYAGLAFAGQLPAAWMIDRLGHPGRWMAGALALLLAAALAVRISPGLAILISGVASALVHVAGGALALGLPRGERALGWFAAPGILGLSLGGWMGATLGGTAWWVSLPTLALLVGWLALRAHWPQPQLSEQAEHTPALEVHDGLMLLLLLALTLRSALWDLVQMSPLENPHALLAVACAAALGKVAGGWMASRWPGLRPIACVLVVACALLEWSRDRVVGLCLGVAMLQSTIPASIVFLRSSLGRSPATASAYVLGLTVALGGFGILLHWSYETVVLGLTLLALVLLATGLRRARLPSSATLAVRSAPVVPTVVCE